MTSKKKDSAPSFSDVLTGIGTASLESVKSNIGRVWDSLTPEERIELTDLVTAIGEVRLRELAGEDVSSFLPILEAGMLQWKAVGSGEVGDAIKAVARDVLALGGAFANSALRGILFKA